MYRIGHAWDTHKLVEGRKLILGGVNVPSHIGLLGHSDADVVYHAVAESLLGALALGDLGTFFPDNDEKNRGMDSEVIMKECYHKVKMKGYVLSNIDLTIYSESIKISPIRENIRKNIAILLETSVDNVSVKATTWEKMGFVGRGEAIACEAVCLIRPSDKKVLL